MDQTISKQIQLLIKDTSAFDKGKKYVNFSHIWVEPNNLEKCAKLVIDYLQELNKDNNYFQPEEIDNLVILSPDNIGGNLGIVPVAFKIAESLGCKAAVWKEFADIKWGTSRIIGTQKPNQKCIVLQDVVDEGTTAIKIALSIKEIKWKFILYITVVFNPEIRESKITDSLSQVGEILGEPPDFRYIVSINSLLEK